MEELNRSSLMETFFTLLSDRTKLHGAIPLIQAGSEGLRCAADRLAIAGDIESAVEIRALAGTIEESAEALGVAVDDEDPQLGLKRELERFLVWTSIVHDDEPLISTLTRLMALAQDDLEIARRPINPRARLRAVP